MVPATDPEDRHQPTSEFHRSISRQARADDRAWFAAHPGVNSRVRDVVPHELCSVIGCGTLLLHAAVLVRRYGEHLCLRRIVRQVDRDRWRRAQGASR